MDTLIKAIRGMNDILPQDTARWHHVEKIMHEAFQGFGYREIRLPIVEKTELFKRSIGEVTDIVEKEMYTFLDRNDESLALRPEGTAGCVRACLEHGLLHNQVQRLWYQGPYFRYERPQKGRYRQFYQCGAEAYGIASPDIDAELIALAATIFARLNLMPHLQLQINSLGTPQTRLAYREKLVAYCQAHYATLDEDSQRRLGTNPLRILDSKNPALQDLIAHAPSLLDHLDDESAAHFQQLQQYLTAMSIPFTVNPRLVRGLDYYTKTVFEWVTDALGAQGTVCAGGRYDDLVAQLGGKATPAVGFAMGFERIILLTEQFSLPFDQCNPHGYLISDSPETLKVALEIAQELRKTCPRFRLMVHCGGGSLKSQFKKADQSLAEIALIIGEQELHNGSISIKFLRETQPQVSIKRSEIADYLAKYR